MAYDNRPNLSCRQFEQRGFDYLYLGGHNCICGTGGTISSNSGYGISGVTILSTGKQLHTLQIGCNSVASGASTAIGAATHALGVATLAIGCGACAFRNNSIALGSQTKACSNYSISIGYDNISCAENSNILGGCGNVICSASTGTVLIGFNNQTIASSSYSGHVIVPNLTILTVPSGTGSVLCRSSNGKIELTCGGITGATNLGIGNGTLYTDISNGNLQFKSLSAGTNITLSCNANYVTINSTASGSESGIGWSNLVNGSTIAGCGTVASASTINCNTAFGVCALGSITSSACSNVGIGYKTLQALTTRCNNTAIGNYAGYSATGNSNVFIGHCAGYDETGSGKLYIATGATNPLIYGDFVNKYVQINGSIIEPYISISSGATVNWDAYAGTNRTLTAGSSFILNLTNLINGMQGDLRLNVTNILSITLPTSKLNGSVIDLTIGVYHLTWTYDGSNLEFSIAKYV